MNMNSPIYGSRIARCLPLGDYEMVCTIEERRDGSAVLVVKENGIEIDRGEFPAAERGDLTGAMAVWDRAWQLRDQLYARAMQGMRPEFARLRPR